MTAGEFARITDAIRKHARQYFDPAGRDVQVLSEAEARFLAERFNCSIREAYIAALRQNIWPLRYVRNREILSAPDQLRLAKARVAVIGAGGLGGHILLLLSRIGIGSLVAIDPDRFDETNLNRQALASVDALGRPKVRVAADTLAAVNPMVEVVAHETALNAQNAPALLSGVHAAVDALDTVADRLILAEAAEKLKIPLVHGAVAGFEGQVTTIYPEDPGLQSMYGSPKENGNHSPAPEHILGVPALAPALISALQAMEIVKLLLNRGQPLRNRMLYADMEAASFEMLGLKR